MDQILERVQSEKLSFVINLFKLLACLVSIAHIIGCIWWAVGSGGSVDSWVVQSNYRDASLEAQYLVSLHWALSQFSGGMDEITPENPTERFYAIVFWII